jgi:Ion transport protein
MLKEFIIMSAATLTRSRMLIAVLLLRLLWSMSSSSCFAFGGAVAVSRCVSTVGTTRGKGLGPPRCGGGSCSHAISCPRKASSVYRSTKESTLEDGERDVQVETLWDDKKQDESRIRQSMTIPAPKSTLPLIFAVGTKKTTMYEAWRLVTIVGAILTAVWAPYEVAFLSPINSDFATGRILDTALWTIFAADMYVHCNLDLAIFPNEQQEEERLQKPTVAVDRSGAKITKSYVASRMFWVDLLGVFPFETVALAVTSAVLAGRIGEEEAMLLPLVRLTSLVRLHRMVPWSDRLQNNPRISLIAFTLARNFAVLFLANHFSACVMYFLARLQDFDEHTWLGPAVVDVSQMNGVERYVVALYQSVVTFSTVGYGVSALRCVFLSYSTMETLRNLTLPSSCINRTLRQQMQQNKYGVWYSCSPTLSCNPGCLVPLPC